MDYVKCLVTSIQLTIPSQTPMLYHSHAALLAAAASDSIDQHEDHSQKTGEKDSYHYPYSTVADSTDGANLNSVNDEQSEY